MIQYGLISKVQETAFLPLIPEGCPSLSENGIYAIGAVKDARACGVLVFRADEMTADILHLAVAEPFRRQGIANGLIDFLCRSAWETATAVISSFSAPDRDDPMCRLLIRRGDFTLEETEDYICRISCKDLDEVELPAALPAGSRIEPFYKLRPNMQSRFFSELKEDNAEFARGLQRDQDQMLKSLCLCVTNESEVQAAVFCNNQDGNVLLSFVYASPNHTRALIALLARLRELLLKAADKVPYLQIAAVTPQSRKLIDKLLPQRETTRRFYMASWDMNTMGE